MIHIGINAHLLSSQKGYRTAGIHGYIYNLLANMTPPEGWQITTMVGANNSHQFDNMTMRRATMDTESPIKRVLWEQTIQPFAIPEFDLYHAMAFVSPVMMTKPSVVTVYDLSFIHYPQVLTPARRLYLRMFTTLSCQRAKRVIAISHSTAQDLHTSLDIPMDKIDVADCGYDEASFKPVSKEDVETFRQKQGLPERFWLFLGTLEPRKNLVTLIEAYACLPEVERLPLILGGGKGWLYDDIFAAIERHQLHDHIHLPGFIPAEDLPLWYNSAEVFIMPSVFEGFGLPVLEAMACGTPVIVSNASSLSEVAGEAGLLVPPHDIDAWVDTLKRIYHDADWRTEASQRGFIEAARYSWHTTVQRTIASYQLALKV